MSKRDFSKLQRIATISTVNVSDQSLRKVKKVCRKHLGVDIFWHQCPEFPDSKELKVFYSGPQHEDYTWTELTREQLEWFVTGFIQGLEASR